MADDITTFATDNGLTVPELVQVVHEATRPQNATNTVDPPVYTGTPATPAVTKGGKARPGSYQHGASPPIIVTPATADSTMSSSAAYKQFLNFTKDERAKIQTDLFVAGYYGSANAHDVLWGEADPGSLEAWIAAVNQAGFAYGAGQKITPEQLIAQQAAGYRAAGVMTDAKGRRVTAGDRAAAAGSGPVVSVTSASELAKMARDLGVSILGRAANADEQRLIIAAVQRQDAAYTGSGGRGERPAPQAIGEDVLRTGAPVEAKAHDAAASYGQLLKIVGGG